MSEYTIIVPSCDQGMANTTIQGLRPLLAQWFDGSRYPSMSKLMNDVLVSAPTEVVVISTDRARVKPEHVERVLQFLRDGYAMGHLHPFGFFATEKEVFRRLGPYDERYVGGNWEDSDMMLRLKEADLAIHEEMAIEYDRACQSRWTPGENTEASRHFGRKWVIDYKGGWWGRRLAEETYTYDFGPPRPDRKYLSWAHSVIGGNSKAWNELIYKGVIE